MIDLPTSQPLSRGPLRAFGMAASLLTAAVGAGVVRAAGSWRQAGVAFAAVSASGAIAAAVRPHALWRPYAWWAHGSRAAADTLTRYTAWVTWTTAISPLQPWEDEARHVTSTWVPARSQPASAYASLSHQSAPAGVDSETATGWRAAARSLKAGDAPRRRWLAACLAVLAWVRPTTDTGASYSAAGDNYSLY